MNNIPENIYEELYDYLVDYFSSISWDVEEYQSTTLDRDFEFESSDNKFFISGNASASFVYIDDSFSHEFGIEEGHHYEVDDVTINYVDDDSAYYYDEENDIDKRIQFDCEHFDHMYDYTSCNVDNVKINEGDTVLYKQWIGKWKIGTFTSRHPKDKHCFYIENDKSRYGIIAYQILPYIDKYKDYVDTYTSVYFKK